jgi:hypothetical protein
LVLSQVYLSKNRQHNVCLKTAQCSRPLEPCSVEPTISASRLSACTVATRRLGSDLDVWEENVRLAGH